MGSICSGYSCFLPSGGSDAANLSEMKHKGLFGLAEHIGVAGAKPSRRTKMTLDDFRNSLTAAEPPTKLTPALAGLWWDAKGDWTRAHKSAHQDDGVEGAWVHAYLHRKEGDQSNAAYWYSRAGKPVCREPLDEERSASQESCCLRCNCYLLDRTQRTRSVGN